VERPWSRVVGPSPVADSITPPAATSPPRLVLDEALMRDLADASARTIDRVVRPLAARIEQLEQRIGTLERGLIAKALSTIAEPVTIPPRPNGAGPSH